MKAQHTPGPWTHTPSREHSNPETTRRDIVAESQFGPAFIAGDIAQSDAALISSAPDLLDALEEMLGDAETMNPPYRNDAICERARAVIAKAKGGES